jgi:hypothetical protein
LDRQLYNQFILLLHVQFTAAQADLPLHIHGRLLADDFGSGGKWFIRVDKQLIVASQDRLQHDGAFQ